MKCIKGIDIFGKYFNFTIDSRKEFNTGLGTVLTILLGISYFVACWYFGQDIYYRRIPQFLKEDSYDLPYPVVNINNSNFNFAFRLETDDADPIQDVRYFEHVYTYKNYIRDNTTGKLITTKSTVTMEMCKEHHISTKELFYQNFLSNYFCTNITNIPYGGNVGISDDIGLLEFRIQRCNSDTEKRHNVTCFNNTKIETDWRYHVKIGTYITQNLIKPKNFSEPIQQTLNYRLDDWDIMVKRKNKVTLSTSVLETDDGWVFSETSSRNFLKFESIEFDNYPPPTVGDAVVEFKFYLSLKRTNYDRSYISIPTIAAKVGGLISLVHTVLNTLISFFIENQLTVFLIEKLLKLELDENNNNDENSISKDYKDVKVNNINNNGNINELSKLDVNKKSREFRDSRELRDSSIIELTPNMINTHLQNPSFDISNTAYFRKSIIDKDPNAKKNYFFSKKDEEIIINKELNKIINFNKKIRERIYISFSEYITIYFPCCFKKNSGISKTKSDLRYDFVKDVSKWISRYIDIIPFLREIDKLNLLKKIILNESQNFMLNNKDKKVLAIYTHNLNENLNQKFLEKKDKKKRQQNQLVEYLIDKKQKQKLTDVDICLFSNLESGMRQTIEEDVNFKIVI